MGCVGRLADCSCPWRGHCSLYQYHDISSASKDIQDIQLEGGAARSCCAQASPAAAGTSNGAGEQRGEVRDQRMPQQLMAGNSILSSERWGAWRSVDRSKWFGGALNHTGFASVVIQTDGRIQKKFLQRVRLMPLYTILPLGHRSHKGQIRIVSPDSVAAILKVRACKG